MNRDSAVVPSSRIRIMGLGGAGCSIIDRMGDRFEGGPASVAVHTNASTLGQSRAPVRLQIGKISTDGSGSGGDPAVGKRSAEDDTELLKGLFDNTDIMFLIAGLGGGTGTGAAPVITRMARDAGVLTMCLTTLPFSFEGAARTKCAEKGLRELLKASELVIVLPNDRLLEEGGEDISLEESYEKVDEAMAIGISAIWQLVSQQGMINIDFADLRNVGRGAGGACAFGYGCGEGPDRAVAATEAALSCAMLGRTTLARSEALMVGIVGDSSLGLREIDTIMSTVNRKTRRGARVFMGAVADQGTEGQLLVTIMAAEHWKDRTTPERDAKARRKTRKRIPTEVEGMAVTQADLNLVTVGRGRFKDVEPTILDGEDLDVPTFIRHGIPIER
jgi:cell division protein FtsZ